MGKGKEAKNLMNAHKIISVTWQTLKKYIPLAMSGEWGGVAEWNQLLKECEELAATGEPGAAKELAKDFSIAIYKYLGNIENEIQQHKTSRPA